MSTTSSHADELVEQIENGDLDPEEDEIDLDPFIEDDMAAMTPELWERLDEETRERYNERVEERTKQDLQSRQAELSEEAEEAVERLSSLAEDRESTETVNLGGDPPVEIEVRTSISGRAERKLSNIDQEGDMEDALETMLDVLCGESDGPLRGLIVSPEKFANREAWLSVWEMHGSVFLFEQLQQILEPARQEIEEIESFRPE